MRRDSTIRPAQGMRIRDFVIWRRSESSPFVIDKEMMRWVLITGEMKC